MMDIILLSKQAMLYEATKCVGQTLQRGRSQTDTGATGLSLLPPAWLGSDMAVASVFEGLEI